jgi:predicted dehydrogenase
MRGHLPALAALQDEGLVTIVGGADPNPDRRRVARLRHPSLAVFRDVATMLEDCRADLLVVASEPASHTSLLLLAAERGVHALCEKPLTVLPAEHALVYEAFRAGDAALVVVQQYRFAPMWRWIVRCARGAARLRAPFWLRIDVDRVGRDAYAASPWREDLGQSGGLLGDHVVHFLGLAREVALDVEPLGASRSFGSGTGETLSATVRVASGTMQVRASTASSVRRTRVALSTGPFVAQWSDSRAVVSVTKHVRCELRTSALSDRDYVDSLYLRLYHDVVVGLRSRDWRREKSAEALDVSRTLMTLFELIVQPGPTAQ